MTLALFPPKEPPDGRLLVAYGGGVNSIAVLVLLQERGLASRVSAITMADPGSEHKGTVVYRDTVLPPWLERHGFPQVTVINRRDEGLSRPRAWRLETLREECVRIRALPSIAYGFKKCSHKYKIQPQRWWLERQTWAESEWDAGRRFVKVIGYDAGESERVIGAFQDPWENERLVPWYPLHDAMLEREDCERMILDAGLPVPPKSACTFCPNNTLAEWVALRDEEPEAFREAVEMSRNAELTAPDVVGLMRCNEKGMRQLHVWADGGYGELGRERETDPMPCECAL